MLQLGSYTDHNAQYYAILELLGLNTRGIYMYTPGSMVIIMPGGGQGDVPVNQHDVVGVQAQVVPQVMGEQLVYYLVGGDQGMMSLHILDINQIASGYRKHEVRKTTVYKQQLNFEGTMYVVGHRGYHVTYFIKFHP